jgi:hypothetical protein
MILACGSLDVVGRSFSPMLPEPIQLGTFLLQTLGGGERQF